jgi:RNA polymerase sigma factor (sigma-70 family)
VKTTTSRDRRGSATADANDDAVTIERSLREPELFAVIFDRYAAHIHRYLARRLGTQTADDVAAGTFLAAFSNRHRYDLTRRDARPWLYGIATNLVGQHRRDEARQQRLALAAYPDGDVACHADRVATEATARSARRALTAALADLSAGDRDVLLLIAWEELTYEQVAAALEIPVGTVRSRLNRARTKVREALGGTDPTMTFEENLSHE